MSSASSQPPYKPCRALWGTIREFSVDITSNRSYFLRFFPSIFNTWNDTTTRTPPILASLMFLI